MCGCSPQTPIQSWSEEGRYLGVQELRLCGNAADGLEAALVRLSKDDLAIKELSLSLGYADWDAGDAMRLLKMAQGLPQLTALNVTLLSFSNEDQVACFTEYLGSTEVVPVLALRLSFGFMPVKQPLLILSQVFDRCQLLELVVDMPLTWEDFHLLCELLYSSPALKGLEKVSESDSLAGCSRRVLWIRCQGHPCVHAAPRLPSGYRARTGRLSTSREGSAATGASRPSQIQGLRAACVYLLSRPLVWLGPHRGKV